MPCTFTEYPGVGSIATTAEPVPGAWIMLGGPFLVVSNHPETIDMTIFNKPANLYKCEIPLSGGIAQRIRVFLWHVASQDTVR
jgi:hypothetical protein